MVIRIKSDYGNKLLTIHKASLDCVRLIIRDIDEKHLIIEVNKKELLSALKALMN